MAQGFIALVFDGLLFVFLPWLTWRLLRRSIPAAVIPIIIGMLLSKFDLASASFPIPSVAGNAFALIGVLLLAFTAGLETRASSDLVGGTADSMEAGGVVRTLLSAGMALALPFVAGTLLAYWLLDLPNWVPQRGPGLHAAMAIGLCAAVSALPVLIGIVREFEPDERRLGGIALRLGAIDDAVLWIGLALLQWAAAISFTLRNLSPLDAAAVTGLWLVAALGRQKQHRSWPVGMVITMAAIWLAAGAWMSSRLGLHELTGAYLAGVTLPLTLTRRLPVERLGRFALFVLAPLYFGHAGLNVAASALELRSLGPAAALLVVACGSKIAAILLVPPRSDLSPAQILAIGALLQCKGMMEILAASILADAGLISESAFAAILMFTIVSTLATRPLFRLFLYWTDGRS